MPRTSAAAMAMPVAAETKLWIASADHLREIGHGGFAAVALPVGVGGEAHGGVERQVRAQRAEALRIERQQMLQPQDRVGEQAAHQAEQQHGEGVLLPVLLLVRLHAHQPIGEPLQRPEHRVEPGPAIGIEHPHEIKPHRLGDQRRARRRRGQVAASQIDCIVMSLEFLRPDHGHEQVDEQQQGNDADDDGFHRSS